MYWNKTTIFLYLALLISACSATPEYPYSNHSALLNTKSWLEDSDDFEPFVYIDLRPKELFDEGHLPGAINLTRKDIRKRNGEISGMAIEADSLAAVLQKHGINKYDWLILYDEKGGVEAARLWWLLRVYGHERVRILNGDLHLFEPVLEYTSQMRQTGDFEFTNSPISDWSVDYQTFENLRGNSGVVLLDCRSAAEFDGEYIKTGAFMAGHIPGAQNICYSHTIDNTSPDNLKIKSPQELAKVYAQYASLSDTVLVYCQSGVRSAHTLLIMREILGYEHVYNYDGSWIEWSYYYQSKGADGPVTKTTEL